MGVTYNLRVHVRDHVLQAGKTIVLEPVSPAKDRDSRVLHVCTAHNLRDVSLQVAELAKHRCVDLDDFLARLLDRLAHHRFDSCLCLVVHVRGILTDDR